MDWPAFAPRAFSTTASSSLTGLKRAAPPARQDGSPRSRALVRLKISRNGDPAAAFNPPGRRDINGEPPAKDVAMKLFLLVVASCLSLGLPGRAAETPPWNEIVAKAKGQTVY